MFQGYPLYQKQPYASEPYRKKQGDIKGICKSMRTSYILEVNSP